MHLTTKSHPINFYQLLMVSVSLPLNLRGSETLMLPVFVVIASQNRFFLSHIPSPPSQLLFSQLYLAMRSYRCADFESYTDTFTFRWCHKIIGGFKLEKNTLGLNQTCQTSEEDYDSYRLALSRDSRKDVIFWRTLLVTRQHTVCK